MTKCNFLVGVTHEARALLKKFCRPCREKEKDTEILVNTILETKNKEAREMYKKGYFKGVLDREYGQVTLEELLPEEEKKGEKMKKPKQKDWDKEFEKRFKPVWHKFEEGEKLLAYSVDAEEVKSFIQKTLNQELRGLLMEECRLNGEMMDEGFSEDFEIGMELGYNQACSNENAKIKKRLEK